VPVDFGDLRNVVSRAARIGGMRESQDYNRLAS
jgi:hypothetical protein